MGSVQRWRRIAVVVGLALMVVGTAHEVVTGKEHWPFSPYPMFSHVERAENVVRYRLVGITAAGERHPLRGDDTLAPMGEARLRAAFRRLADQPAARDRALADVARSYEVRRRGGEHRGPKLSALVLERWTWRMHLDPGPDAAAMELLSRQPVTRYPAATETETPAPTTGSDHLLSDEEDREGLEGLESLEGRDGDR